MSTVLNKIRFSTFNCSRYNACVKSLIDSGCTVEVRDFGHLYLLRSIGNGVYQYICDNHLTQVSSVLNTFPDENPAILWNFYRKMGWMIDEYEVSLIFDGIIVCKISMLDMLFSSTSCDCIMLGYHLVSVYGKKYFMDVIKFCMDLTRFIQTRGV
jgi:hypothetical protein